MKRKLEVNCLVLQIFIVTDLFIIHHAGHLFSTEDVKLVLNLNQELFLDGFVLSEQMFFKTGNYQLRGIHHHLVGLDVVG